MAECLRALAGVVQRRHEPERRRGSSEGRAPGGAATSPPPLGARPRVVASADSTSKAARHWLASRARSVSAHGLEFPAPVQVKAV